MFYHFTVNRLTPKQRLQIAQIYLEYHSTVLWVYLAIDIIVQPNKLYG